MSASTFVFRDEVDGEVSYRRTTVIPTGWEATSQELTALDVRRELSLVEPPRAPSRPSDGVLARIAGRYFNVGTWKEVRSSVEARSMGLTGDTFMERMAPGSFDRAIELARSGAHLSPRLLFNHGHDGTAGRKPIGVITRLDPGGTFEANIYDTSYTRDLLPALEAGQFGTSYAFRGTTRGELKRSPKRSEHNPRGLPEATMRDVGEIKEISIVTFPADENTIVQVLSPSVSLAA